MPANSIYDPSKFSFKNLLEVFWIIHDPTRLSRQGNDIGTQYRSVIFFHNNDQKTIAEGWMAQLAASVSFSKPIVTSLEPFTRFYLAEN